MKPSEEAVKLVRNFAENSVKFLLRDKDNAREGLTLIAPDKARLIDFERMTVMKDSFIAPDFRHLETDLLLRAPMRGKAKQTIYVYQLIEHQSEPDDHAVYRAIRYQVQVFDLQTREWLATHGNLRGLLFDPVIPVVIYTGTRTWETLTPMVQLVKKGKQFAKQTPDVEPEFFNLATTPAKKLHGAGLFGWVLHLMQQRLAKGADFRALLAQVVRRADALPDAEKGRWQDLLWYLRAMVYHVREKPDHEPLAELIYEKVNSKARKEEVRVMGQTMAEYLEEKGEKKGVIKGKQEMLLGLLSDKFKTLPAGIEAEVRATGDEAKLAAWSKEVLRARKLSEMSFTANAE